MERDIFEKGNNLLCEIINRCLDCREYNIVYICGDLDEYIKDIYWSCKKVYINELSQCEDNSLIVIRLNTDNDNSKLMEQIQMYRLRGDMIIWLQGNGVSDNLSCYSGLSGNIVLMGKTFEFQKGCVPNKEFRVLAIIHFYNEADILERTIKYLLTQDVDIYLVDNWSDDGSYEIAKKYFETYRNRIYLERFPSEGRTRYYEWYRQLERTEQISREMGYDWYIHYDTDEMRVSPWKNTTLRECLYYIDKLGYNLVDNTVIDFKLTDNCQADIFMEDTYFDFGHRNMHFLQLKTWKRTDDIDIKKIGGHVATVKNPKVFPLKILNRHYPMRSVQQAEKKIFKDRIPRFEKEKKERGWHGHYDKISNINDVICDKNNLILWDELTLDKYYIPLFTGVGVKKETANKWNVGYETCEVKGKKIILYGAGVNGKKMYLSYARNNDIVAWVDIKYYYFSRIYGMTINNPDIISKLEYDFVFITIKNSDIQTQVIEKLIAMGVDKNKIVIDV